MTVITVFLCTYQNTILANQVLLLQQAYVPHSYHVCKEVTLIRLTVVDVAVLMVGKETCVNKMENSRQVKGAIHGLNFIKETFCNYLLFMCNAIQHRYANLFIILIYFYNYHNNNENNDNTNNSDNNNKDNNNN